jgi:hypothetical protein
MRFSAGLQQLCAALLRTSDVFLFHFILRVSPNSSYWKNNCFVFIHLAKFVSFPRVNEGERFAATERKQKVPPLSGFAPLVLLPPRAKQVRSASRK